MHILCRAVRDPQGLRFAPNVVATVNNEVLDPGLAERCSFKHNSQLPDGDVMFLMFLLLSVVQDLDPLQS